MESKKIGFAGLGIMGSGMARRFLTKAYPLAVWNRTRSSAETLATNGAEVADTPEELAARSDVLFTALSTPDAVRAVALGANGLLSGAKPGAYWIDTSTIGPACSLELARAAAQAGVHYLEAPVTGSKMGARDGTLLAMVGGSPDVYETCREVLAVFCQRTIYIGEHGQGQLMKLLGNAIISFMLEGLAEAAVLGAAGGISLERILDVVQASGFASPYFAFKGGAMMRRDFETHFAVDLLHKDQTLALAEGTARRIPQPGLAAIHQVTAVAQAHGFGGEDIAAQLKAVEALSRA
jgi:3-hydroxyisobutyrate dehydrogenase